MSKIPKKAGKDTVELGTPDVIPSSPYTNIQREISEQDLQTPAVQRILLGEVDKLQNKVDSLELVQNQFHNIDKKAAILEEKLKSTNAHEILYTFSLTIGSVIIGLSPTLWSTKNNHGIIALIVGAILIVGGIASKVIKKWN